MTTRVLIAPSSFGVPDDTPLRRLRDAGLEVVENPHGRRLTKEELLSLLPGITGVVAGLEPYDRDVLEGSDLRVVSRCGSGMANVDTQAAAELDIAVRGTPEAPVEAVAELTLAAMLALLRHAPMMDRALHARAWDKRVGTQLDDATVAVVGFGRIGRRVAELVRVFGATVLAVDPDMADVPDGVEAASLDEALGRADVVTVHAAGEDRVLGAEEIASMQEGAFLLNAARGGVVDEDALATALGEGRLAGAWVDAFEEEPYEGPLCDLENALLTPHVGTYTTRCRADMEMQCVENLLAALGEG